MSAAYVNPREAVDSAGMLYDTSREHDACGVCFVASLSGAPSPRIVSRALVALGRMAHRAAAGADNLDGDGAGILLQLPHELFSSTCPFELLCTPGDYAVGNVFFPRNDASAAEESALALERAVVDYGMKVLGWRDVPTDSSVLGESTRQHEPRTRQIFVGRTGVSPESFELRLFLARKRAENEMRERGGSRDFYVCSLSSRTIVYKGMFVPEALGSYYRDLIDKRTSSALAVVHSRYSTNTFPTWPLAHPFRLAAHNGEFNTLRGNLSHMRARESLLRLPEECERGLPPGAREDLCPAVAAELDGGSDTACFDNVLELLLRCGRSLEEALTMLVPDDEARCRGRPQRAAYFQYKALLTEPWDGPANVVACDGTKLVAVLDRSGLRPARWSVTGDEILYASEAGVLDGEDAGGEQPQQQDRLGPGEMLVVDTAAGKIMRDDEIKERLANRFSYTDWTERMRVKLEELPAPPQRTIGGHGDICRLQRAFGYTHEDLATVMAPMCTDGQQAMGAMGDDAPLAVLSARQMPLSHFFRQLFAQVTNPPIDPMREEIVLSMSLYLGSMRGNMLRENPEPGERFLRLQRGPLINNDQLEVLRHANLDGFRGTTLSAIFASAEGVAGLSRALQRLGADAEKAVDAGFSILVVSDRGVDANNCPVPSALAVAAVHQRLLKAKKRSRCSIVAETGEPHQVHDFAVLVSCGAEAVNPYLAYLSIQHMVDRGVLKVENNSSNFEEIEDAVVSLTRNYERAVVRGLEKVIARLGISVLQSYHSAQLLEAIGLDSALVEQYFPGTPSRIGGIGLAGLARELLDVHAKAFIGDTGTPAPLGFYSFMKGDNVEEHTLTPNVVRFLHKAVRENDRSSWTEFSEHVDSSCRRGTLRGLLRFNSSLPPVPLEEVESAESIFKRFTSSAISLGAISLGAHQVISMAMNSLGTKSNTGEGGELSERLSPTCPSRCGIRQVASARFGVTAAYLANADEIQIKMAQGAKPGEGGQLPGKKVTKFIADLRHSVPGVTLISPPPHHDIYSIEDLAQLVSDLQSVAPRSDISVKLTSQVGIGAVASGVAKSKATGIVVSGGNGGTGSSPLSSIYFAGLPWELGLAEAHQALVSNGLRERITLEVDGSLRTARDVVIGAMLGADRFGFGTVTMLAVGCVMCRRCYTNTCPVGIATQDPILCKRFSGTAEHVMQYFKFLAEDVRQILSSLGLRSLGEAVGRTDLLCKAPSEEIPLKGRGVDLSRLLRIPQPVVRSANKPPSPIKSEKNRVDALALATLLDEDDQPNPGEVVVSAAISNRDRSIGTRLSGEIARLQEQGTKVRPITVRMDGTAGLSLGAFLVDGVTLSVTGGANDFVGKGLCGGTVIVKPPTAEAEPSSVDRAIIGNTALYGATSGEVFISGSAGQRFAVRCSGARAVVEGVGDHACEYMTGGIVVVIGKTGRNFAAGMSGGMAFVHDPQMTFRTRCNTAMVDVEQLVSPKDADMSVEENFEAVVKNLIQKHLQLTGSPRAKSVLEKWEEESKNFVVVFPREYRRLLVEGALRRSGSFLQLTRPSQ